MLQSMSQDLILFIHRVIRCLKNGKEEFILCYKTLLLPNIPSDINKIFFIFTNLSFYLAAHQRFQAHKIKSKYASESYNS